MQAISAIIHVLPIDQLWDKANEDMPYYGYRGCYNPFFAKYAARSMQRIE